MSVMKYEFPVIAFHMKNTIAFNGDYNIAKYQSSLVFFYRFDNDYRYTSNIVSQ